MPDSPYADPRMGMRVPPAGGQQIPGMANPMQPVIEALMRQKMMEAAKQRAAMQGGLPGGVNPAMPQPMPMGAPLPQPSNMNGARGGLMSAPPLA